MKTVIFALVLLGMGEIAGRTNADLMGRKSQDPRRDAAAIQVFLQNVDRYVTLRTEAASTIPAARAFDPWAFLFRVEKLSEAIRARRSDARVGDIFTFEVRIALRAIIDRSICAQGLTADEVIRGIEEETVPGALPPAINKPFPWQFEAMMPPYLLAHLPKLPRGIQYRIVGRDLVLIDLESTLVVDILREALNQSSTTRPTATSS